MLKFCLAFLKKQTQSPGLNPGVLSAAEGSNVNDVCKTKPILMDKMDVCIFWTKGYANIEDPENKANSPAVGGKSKMRSSERETMGICKTKPILEGLDRCKTVSEKGLHRLSWDAESKKQSQSVRLRDNVGVQTCEFVVDLKNKANLADA